MLSDIGWSVAVFGIYLAGQGYSPTPWWVETAVALVIASLPTIKWYIDRRDRLRKERDDKKSGKKKKQ